MKHSSTFGVPEVARALRARAVAIHRLGLCFARARSARATFSMCLAVFIASFFLLTSAAQAQDYSFSVPLADVTVTIEKEGSALIHYKLTFACNSGAHSIDVVDIGMPTRRHKAVSAAINGAQLSDIRKSEYIDNGYEVHLGSGAIGPGSKGVFEFTGRSFDMVWQDTTDKSMASFRFSPTWFGAKFVTGDTLLTLRFKLPPGEYPDPNKNVLWQKNTPPFQWKGIIKGDNAPSVMWSQRVRLVAPHTFGVSFPKDYVAKVQQMTIWKLFLAWFSNNKDVKMGSGIVLLVLFSIVFFLSTSMTGCALWLILCGGMIFGMYKSDVIHLGFYPGLLILAVALYMYRNFGRKHYVPAEISRETGPVKIGLTPPEAAVLLDKPGNKILSMLMFDLVKRGHLEIAGKQPLTLRPLSSSAGFNRLKLPNGDMILAKPYEVKFIECVAANPGVPMDQIKFDSVMKSLVGDVVQTVKGCDLERTRNYCKETVRQALERTEREENAQTRANITDKHLGWLMLHDDFDNRAARWTTHGRHYHYRPLWWYHHHLPRTDRGQSSALDRLVPTGGKGDEFGVSFSDVLNSISGSLEKNTDFGSFKSEDAIKSFDLSTLDKITSDMIASSGRGGSCVGGGCACACAGCACACACAGGGR